MSRYIDADKLVADLQHCSYETWSKDVNRAWWAQAVNVKDNIVHYIERHPTADVVEVRHGEWREHPHIGFCGYNGSSYECSNCHKEVHDLEDMNFCSNCGAKMDGRRAQNEG